MFTARDIEVIGSALDHEWQEDHDSFDGGYADTHLGCTAEELEHAIDVALPALTALAKTDVLPVTLPFGLGRDELVLEPEDQPRKLSESLAWLAREAERIESGESGLVGEHEAILRSAVLLYTAGAGTLDRCLDTAIVWARG